MHIFLTGATGFMGRNLLKGLLDAGHRITAIIRPESPKKHVLPSPSDRLHFVYGNFFDPVSLAVLREPFDVLIHTAAIRGAGKADFNAYRLVNVQGTRVLLEFALKNEIPRFLYFSTVGVLGTIPKRLPARAQDDPRPDNLYHQTKWEAEEIVRKIPRHALSTLILRPTITYGAYDDGFVPRLLQFVRRKHLVLPKKEVKVHLLFVQSLVRLVNQILAVDFFNNRTYLIADREAVSLQKIADLLKQHTGGDYYRLPEIFFKMGERVFSLLGRPDLRTSLQLLSQSWYFDVSPIQKDFLFDPVDTLRQLPEVLTEFYEQGKGQWQT